MGDVCYVKRYIEDHSWVAHTIYASTLYMELAWGQTFHTKQVPRRSLALLNDLFYHAPLD
jgi:hypothetical protein